MALFAKKLGFTERATAPATPVAGNKEVYYKTDGLLYSKDSAGVETIIGGNIAWTDFSASAVLAWDIVPADVVKESYTYRIINGFCFYEIHISASDGNNATTLNITLPQTPVKSIYSSGQEIIGEVLLTLIPILVYAGPNKIIFTMNTATDGSELHLYASGFYPV
jgi:hypothetical protein